MSEATNEVKTEEKKPLGNALFQEVVAKPYAAALAVIKAAGQTTPKNKSKAKAKRKLQKASRRRNRK